MNAPKRVNKIPKVIYKLNNTKPFSPIGSVNKEHVQESLDYAYGMSFGKKGHHRNYRTGGKEKRKDNQIFADAFQGKLAEFALYQTLIQHDLNLDKPDTEMFEKGVWDTCDLDYKNTRISIKSTKHFGQLLLLETDDWDEEGLYIPDKSTGYEDYDYFVLVRIKPFPADLMKKNKIYYTENLKYHDLEKIIKKEDFFYDIPGCISRETLKWLIKNNFIIEQGNYINKIDNSNKLDANNYYIQSGDLFDIKKMIEELN